MINGFQRVIEELLKLIFFPLFDRILMFSSQTHASFTVKVLLKSDNAHVCQGLLI